MQLTKTSPLITEQPQAPFGTGVLEQLGQRHAQLGLPEHVGDTLIQLRWVGS
jgi:hypothetical protein